MRTKTSFPARVAVAALGGLLLSGVAGAAFAADQSDDDDVTVNVEIAPNEPAGALTLSVAANSTSLTEGEPDAEGNRVFDGVLPSVTVTDDRDAVPADTYWYVNGQSSAFAGPDGATIGPDRLGWVPNVIDDGDGQVAAGDEIVTSLDEPTLGSGATGNNVGLAGEELFAIAPNVAGELTPGEWTATAALRLKTPANQTPGAYSATLTLTLWESGIDG